MDNAQIQQIADAAYAAALAYGPEAASAAYTAVVVELRRMFWKGEAER